MERPLRQRLIAEFVGTFTWIFAGCSSVVLALGIAQGELTTVGLAHGIAVAVMVSSLGHVSGGHFNPAVTIAMWVPQKIGTSDALAYIAAQLAGGAAGAGVLRAAVPETFWGQVALGTPTVNASLSNGNAVLIEAVLTFFLVWVIYATAVDPEGAFAKIAGLAIGLTVAMGHFAGFPLTGAAMNPARWFGPAVATGTYADWWVYWMGPIAGAIVAGTIYDTFILAPHLRMPLTPPEELPHGVGTHGEEDHA